ncbi:short-chain dehydrogenase/reductase 2 [Aspergillus ambiguus]|uniref:short-chain dehydrogenase/reductase 2 n=1 Tax=Aspergillus ambiguus TaxID=176160 RepID=UPI003CCD5742
MSLITAAQQGIQTAFRNLPPSTQKILSSSLLPGTLTALLGYVALSQINSVLNSWSLNCLSDQQWQNERELVLVTGGCSGIGKAVMEGLSQYGVKVIIVDIQEPCFELPLNVVFYRSDITSTAALHQTANQIRAEHGHPTVLVNNAGIMQSGTILDQSEAAVRQTFEVNTMAHYWTVKEFIPAMVERNHGHVVTVASMASFMTVGKMASYCCTKASALAFHEGLTQELKYWSNVNGVKTSVIHPLYVETPMIKALTKGSTHFNRPVLPVKLVAHEIVQQILSGKSGQIILPKKLWWMSLLRGFPLWLQEGMRNSRSQSAKSLEG